jgi:hypothetical protein
MFTASRDAGEVVARPAWGKDQPNNYNGEQNCVVLDGGRNWLWNDVGCNLDYLHWICQHSKCSVLFDNAGSTARDARISTELLIGLAQRVAA